MVAMTNEELVQLIKDGNRQYYHTLWEQTSKLIYRLIDKHGKSRILPNDIDFEDIQQCGYFAMVEAVRLYSEDKGLKFNTYLEYQVMTAINKTIDRGQRKRPQTARIKERSYNVPITDNSGNKVEWLDLIADESTKPVYSDLELTDLQETVWQAVAQLPPSLKEVIVQYYFKDENFPTQAQRLGVSVSLITQRSKQAFRLLRKDKDLRQLYFEVYAHYTHSEDDITLLWAYSPERYTVAREIQERKTNGEYLTYGKEQQLLSSAFQRYREIKTGGISETFQIPKKLPQE